METVIRKIILIPILLLALGSCNPLGNIRVTDIVNPDKYPPDIIYVTTAPAVMNGKQDFHLEFEVNDDPAGSGISSVILLYSPDGKNEPFKSIGEFDGGHRSINFCTPNKNHPAPAFKIVAKDRNNNSSEKILGLTTGQALSIATTEPLLPVISSSEGLTTKNDNTEILIDACKMHSCSAGALFYETPTHELSVAVGATRPGAADAAWISCKDVLSDGYTLPDFPGDGDYTYKLWTKTSDTDHDGSPLTIFSSTSRDITVNHDGTAPTITFNTASGSMNSHTSFGLSFDLGDASSGLSSAKLFYSPDLSNIASYPYVEIGTLSGGTPETKNFCVPNKTHPAGVFKIVATDNYGNTISATKSVFTINKSANPLLPNVSATSLASPATGGSSKVWIDACKQHVCAAGSLFYEAADNAVFVSVKNTQPSTNDVSWVSCSDVLTNGYSFSFPPQTGSGVYSTSLWMKSKGKDLDGIANVETVSTSSVPISLPYDYTPPALTNLNLGNLGTNKNLQIVGTGLLTGYSIGSFRLDPSCIDPASIPAIQGYISGTVSVSADNLTVTGVGTNFLTDFRPYDYTEINGIYTQIKSIDSATQMTLNEVAGNKSGLVGTGLQASVRMDSYGGIYVNKGAAPSATDPGWQPCDSVLQTIRYADLVNGTNNLNFWVKDRGNNVSTAFIPFTVTYNAPVISVVNGPTISTVVADLSINACGGGTKITHVLFNETGTQPLATDAQWQSCSTAIGALKSPALTPGPHTLKAFFKYSDNLVSFNPVNVPVNYLPTVAWNQSPLTIRPQTTFTLASCTGIDAVYVNQSTAPLATAPEWQPCSTASGAINYTLSTLGSQTVNVWYKSGTTVSSDFSQVTVNFVPPIAYLFGGSIYQTAQPPLCINTCSGISKVFIKVDDASPVTPIVSDFSSADSRSCTTALNGVIPPSVVGEGNHTYDVWFQFSDGYILSPWYSRSTFTYQIADTTAPPVTAGQGATTPLSLFLENGDGDGAVPGVTETIEGYSSRANFTLNTCTPKPSVALTGTVTVSAGSSAVTGSGTLFTSQLVAGDFIEIGAQKLKIKSISSNTSLTLILTHTAGASGVAAKRAYPEDEITGMILTESSTAPDVNDSFWLACSNANADFKTPSLTDGPHSLYAWFKDKAGNVSTLPITKNIIIDTTPDVTPPPRPPVIVEGAPRITTAPAKLTITSCSDVDQVYVEPSQYPSAYVTPNATRTGWQNCTTGVGAITFPVDLAGSYTVSVWFKDAAGNINPVPRDVSFIFDPAISNLPNPIAYWTMDKTHLNKNRVIDAKGNSHLYRWDPAEVTEVAGKGKEALKFSGSRSYLFTENNGTLKPATAVTISMWAYLTKNEAATKGLAGNDGFGLKLQGGNLVFFASGETNTISVPTSSYQTGWRHIAGTSDGRYLKLYIDGKQVSSTLDLGSAANLTYGSAKLFVVGGLPDGSAPNPSSSNLFDERIDEVIVWDQFFSDEMAMNHYIDSYNNYKVKQDAVPPANIASASFYGEFLQNALITLPSCGDAKFIYVNETTHPPTVDTPDWQLCNTVKGGIIHPGLAQGAHQLKIWAKDEYDNITSGYLKLETTITGMTYQPPGVLYYTFDNNQTSLSTVFDIFSGHTSVNVGADQNQPAIQNEGYLFSRATSDFVERQYAFNAQPKDKVSLSVWANLTSSDNREQVIAGTKAGSHGYSLEINQASNELRFNVVTSSGLRYAGITTSAYTSGFHNVIGVYDGRYVRLYIDGAEVVSTDYATTAVVKYDCLGSFIVGAESSCNTGPVPGTHFDNVIDEVVVWDSALSPSTIYSFYNGQDTIPPVAVPVTPKNNEYNIGIPVARLNVSDCTDIASVYVSLDGTKPLRDIANWQTCSTSGDLIKSPLLETGANNLRVWFKDAAGNVSAMSTDLVMNFTYDFTIPAPDSYWTFDDVNVDGGIAYDVINDRNGTISGPVLMNGIASESLKFDGVDDFVEVPFNSVFQPSGEVSLSVWFKAPSYGVTEKALAGNFSSGGYGLFLNNNALEFRAFSGGVTKVISTSTLGLDVSKWHHAVGIFQNGTLRLFLDGSEILPTVTASATVITYSNSNSLTVGAAAPAATGNSGSLFTGQLDEVAFWNRALSDTVVAEIYDRGLEGDQVAYDVVPPQIPTNLNITYYNSLVSRANLTINSCVGLNYVIVTKDEFPPDKNDENWQKCNTLVGGLLSQELRKSDAFGKLWTKDLAGNISRSFEYVAVTTNYDKPIARPVVHWTFDNSHYVAATKSTYDRLGQINLKESTLKNTVDPSTCQFFQGLDTASSALLTGQTGVLNESFLFGIQDTNTRPTILRATHPQNITTKPADKLSVSAWVYIIGNTTSYDKHIVSNLVNGKGWALRIHAPTIDDRGLRFTVNASTGTVEPYLETKNISTGWHLVTGTFDGLTASLFMDGIFVKSFSLPNPGIITYEPGVHTFVGSQASTTTLPTRWETFRDQTSCASSVGTIGNIPDNSYYENKIDEVIIWDKSLSKLEVSSLYHNGADILYSSDTTPPSLPALVQENSKSQISSPNAYFSLSTCFAGGAVENIISGVLVNEGTMPDKQDERWQSCRTRLGSFGLENLSPGGHTITMWFKDLAGNVTPVSADYVVNYVVEALPPANAVWPLDKTHNNSKYSAEVIGNKANDFLLVNIDTPLNPMATQVAGVVNEGINLASTSVTNGAFLSATSTRVLRPVNLMSVGGWFYLTSGDAATKVLLDHHTHLSSINRAGYKFDLNSGSLRFTVELDIDGTESLSVPTSSYTTGWHHVIGVFTGTQIKLYIDSNQVAASSVLVEKDYIRYDTPTDFRVGAESENNSNPTSFFGEKVDEITLWGLELKPAQVTNVYSANNAHSHIYVPLAPPVNVENAYIYHYGNFGSRARMTILDCTKTPYIYVTKQNAPAPTGSEVGWSECNTTPGAIISTKLDVGTMYVDVYAKNADGVVSSVPGRKEILPILYDYDLVLPITYLSFNQEHAVGAENDFIIRAQGVVNGTPTRVANNDGQSLQFSGSSFQYVNVSPAKIYDLRDGLSIALWADITQGDAGLKLFARRNSPAFPDDTSLFQQNGYLTFRVTVPTITTTYRSTTTIDATFPTSLIKTGMHFIVGTFDGTNVQLYLDSKLVGVANPGQINYVNSLTTTIAMNGIGGFRIGESTTGKIDEFMVFDRVLSEKEMVAWYRRYNDALSAMDTTAPAAGRNLSVLASTFGTNWPTDNATPKFTIDNCTDVFGVYISLSSTPPAFDDAGWQDCQTLEGYLNSPALNPGSNTVYFYYKDPSGNISTPDQITVNYNVPPLPAPVAYWNLDDDSKIGERIYEPVNQLHAHTFGVVPADYSAGVVGKAVFFDGKRKYVKVDSDPIIKPTKELSVGFWIDVPPTYQERSDRTILGTRGNTASEGYTFRWTCNSRGNYFTPSYCGGVNFPYYEFFEFILTVDGIDRILDVPVSAMGFGPMFIMATFDGRSIKLYKNDTLLKKLELRSKGLITYNATNKTSLIVGAMSGTDGKPSGQYFRGKIDELMIFNKGLYANHVADIYNNYIQANNPVFDPGLAVITPPDSRARIYEPAKTSFGSRLRLTMSDCTDTNMILVNSSLTPPLSNDENWQPCNTYQGGILSAPLATNMTVTPRIWAKSFTGEVSPSAGTANGETFAMHSYVTDVPRPKVSFSLDSTFAGYTSGLIIKDTLSGAEGLLGATGPTSTVIQLSGTFTVAPGTKSVSGNGTAFLTELKVGDRIKIDNETVQVKTIIDDFNLTTETNHLDGSTNLTAYRVGSKNTEVSVIEGGYKFNGITDLIKIKPNASTNSMYDLTISAWVELQRGETAYRNIIGNDQNGASSTGAGAGLRIKNGQLQFFVSGYKTSTTILPLQVAIDTNIYYSGVHHVAGTYNGESLKLYLDGVFVKSYEIPLFDIARYELFNDDYSNWTIGAETGSLGAGVAGSFFEGVIDEVNIWHKALTEQQIYYVYNSGSSYLPMAIPDGIAPTDPGIFLSGGMTSSSSPWASFTMPSCTGANGLDINAVYVNLSTDPVPTNSDSGWQLCSLDADYIISSLLNRGDSTINVYFRDSEGDISTPTPFAFKYTPPELVQPRAYYSFNGTDRNGNLYYYDKAGTKHIRSYPGNSPIVAGRAGNGWKRWNDPDDIFALDHDYVLDETYRVEYDFTKNFTASFWYNPISDYNGVLLGTGQFSISRTASNNVLVTVAAGANQSGTSVKTLIPKSWNHIGVIRENEHVNIYINGRLDSTFRIADTNLNNSPEKLTMAGIEGIYDEVVLYDRVITPDQMGYIYFKGMKAETIDVFVPNLIAAPTPYYYWNFNNSYLSGLYIDSVTQPLPLRIAESVSTGQTDARTGQSFSFQRFEDNLNGGESAINTIGKHQYLESDTAAPFTLGTEFTISTWVKQPVTVGYYGGTTNSPHNDQTAILDMWGTDDKNKSFILSYTRAAATGSTPTAYQFSVRIGNTNYSVSTSTVYDNFRPNSNWVHLVVRRKGKVLAIFVDGVESGSINTLPDTLPLNTPEKTRLRVGDSSLYSYYHIPGTVTVSSGSTNVTGTGTQFLTDLFEMKTGTVTVSAGSTTVNGNGTLFTDLAPGQFIKINNEVRQISAITNNTFLTLTTAHVAGATNATYFKRSTNTIRIGLQNFTIANITSDTQLTLSSAHTTGATNEKLGLNINDSDAASIDEYAFNGKIDELAIWNTALPQRQIYDLTVRGNLATAVPVNPEAALSLVNGGSTVATSRAKLKFNDCNGFTYVWIGFAGDAVPLATDSGDGTYPGWVVCDPSVEYDSPLLATDASNSLRIWFRTGSTVSGYTYDIPVTQLTGDVTPPSIPMITMQTASPTASSFARFTVASCNDIAGVYVGNTGPAPLKTSSSWQNCTTVPGEIVSKTLTPGVNNLSVWLKDATGNISTSTDFSLTYNEPTIPRPELYLTMDDAQISTSSFIQREISYHDFATANNTATMTTGRAGVVNQSVDFNTNSFFEFQFNQSSFTNTLSVFSWVNIATPATDSHLIGKWNGTSANDAFAVRVDINGRICLDFQTTASTGTWNTSAYKRICSSAKIAFGAWHHVGVIRNGSSLQFLIDNKSAGTATIDSSPFKSSPLTIRVGAQARGAISPVDGLLDEVAIWNVALSATEREYVYGKGKINSTFIQDPVSVDPALAPSHYWKFETAGPLDDTSSSPLHFATSTGASLETTGGIINDFFSFLSGSSSLLTSSTPMTLGLATDFTISFWMKRSTLAPAILVNKWDTSSSTAQEFQIGMNGSGQIYFNYYLATPLSGVLTSVDAVPATWAHITVARKGMTLVMYINGRAQAITKLSTDLMKSLSTVSLSVGGNAINGSSYYTGAIDDLVIYNSYLHEKKIKFNIDNGLAGNPIVP